MFHLTATTAEEMRAAVVEWLEAEATALEKRIPGAKRKRDAAEYRARASALGEAARIFRHLTLREESAS